jgi:raffinose/stachyose/melibiose transport system substrate-binding protein
MPVTVVTAASGTYSETLTAEMDKGDSAPTLFQCGNQAGVTTWGDYCYDFAGTDVYAEMTTDDFNLFKDSGEVAAIGYCYECFGIIVNKALLEQAGYSLDDITDFASLKMVAEDIHGRAAELGFDAFTSSGMDGSSSWRFSGHLANMPLFYEFRDDGVTAQPAAITGAYLDNFKNIWDLYINNSATDPTQLATATGDQAEAEFGEGSAVFYQNGSWEYSNLTTTFGMSPDDLAMIPIYCGVDGESEAGLCCGTENCWAVNSQASAENIQATLDFLYWVVTSDEGTAMMAEQFGPIPFKNAKDTENVFFNDANADLAEGKYVVTWAFNYTPNVDNWRAGVVAALTQYSAGTGSWDDVITAFVAGWATQYAAQ